MHSGVNQKKPERIQWVVNGKAGVLQMSRDFIPTLFTVTSEKKFKMKCDFKSESCLVFVCHKKEKKKKRITNPVFTFSCCSLYATKMKYSFFQ